MCWCMCVEIDLSVRWQTIRFQSESSCSKLDFQTLIIRLSMWYGDDLRMKEEKWQEKDIDTQNERGQT